MLICAFDGFSLLCTTRHPPSVALNAAYALFIFTLYITVLHPSVICPRLARFAWQFVCLLLVRAWEWETVVCVLYYDFLRHIHTLLASSSHSCNVSSEESREMNEVRKSPLALIGLVDNKASLNIHRLSRPGCPQWPRSPTTFRSVPLETLHSLYHPRAHGLNRKEWIHALFVCSKGGMLRGKARQRPSFWTTEL